MSRDTQRFEFSEVEGKVPGGPVPGTTFLGVSEMESPLVASAESGVSGLSRSDAWIELERVLSGAPSPRALEDSEWLRLAGELAEQDPGRALDVALKLPSGQQSHVLCVEAYRALARRDGPGAWKALHRLGPGSMEEDASLAVLQEWAVSDPRAAAMAAATTDSPNGYQIKAVAGLWAERDPDAALAWAASISEPAGGEAVAEAARGAMSQAGDQFNPMEMERLLAGVPDPTKRAAASAAVAVDLWMIDEEASMQWFARLRDSEQEAAVIALSAARSQESAPHLAEALVPLLAGKSSMVVSGDLTDAVAAVAEDYASVDAPAAARWALSLDSNFREEAINLAMKSWTERDPVAAAEWLESQRASAASAAARLAFAGSIATHDPQAALAWARSCPPSPERDSLVGFLSSNTHSLEE